MTSPITRLLTMLGLFGIIQACNFSYGGGGGGLIADNKPVENKFTASVVDGMYINGDNIDIQMAFPFDVTVTGTPSIDLDIGGVTRTANYVSGNGTKNLIFRYNVTLGDTDTDGITVVSPTSLNGGTLTFDDNGTPTNCELAIDTPNTDGVLVDSVVATITNFTAPADNLYTNTESLTFNVTFDEAVTVTGTPRLVINVGGSTIYADYASGTGTAILNFTYTVGPADIDIDGIGVASPIDLNAGTIQDAGGNNADLTFLPPGLSGVLVNGDTPFVVSSTAPPNATYVVGQNIDTTLTFSEIVNVTGSPRLQLTIGAATVYADYLSGSGTTDLLFRYTVQPEDEDLDGIDLLPAIDLNGGTIADGSLTPALLTFDYIPTGGVIVDGRVPDITSITPSANATYIAGQNLTFTTNWDIAVTVTGVPRLAINMGGITVYATYVSGSGGTALIFQYTVLAGDNDTDGIDLTTPLDLNGGTIQGTNTVNANLAFTAPDTSGVIVDAHNPTITSVTGPADGSYKAGQNLDFTVNFSESVTVSAIGTANINITIGSTAYTAVCTSGTGTSTTCTYTVQAGDTDDDGIASSSPLSLLASNTIKDAAGNDLVLTFTPPTTTAVLVDTTAPTITSVTPPANQTYAAGESLSFVVNLDENVDVSGTPQLQLDIGSSTVNADYASGTGSAALTFTYVVQAGDLDADGIGTTSPLGLNGGTIQDTATNDAVLTFNLPNTAGVNVDAVGPVIIGHTAPTAGTYLLNDNIDIVVHYNEPVAVSGSPTIDLDLGGVTRSARYFSGTGSANITFRYTVQASEEDLDGVAYVTTIALNTGSMQDTAANAAELLVGAISTPTVYVDSLAPKAALTNPGNNTYVNIANDSAAFTVAGTCDDATATYDLRVSGANQTTLSCDGMNLTGTIDTTVLAESTQDWDIVATDPASNSSTSTTNSVTRDITAPTITSVTTTASGVQVTGGTVSFTANLSESVTVSAGPRLTLAFDTFTVEPYANCAATTATSTTCDYIVDVGDYDDTGLVMNSPLDLNTGTITDAAGNDLNTAFTPPDLSAITINNIYPEFEFYKDSALTKLVNPSLDFGSVAKPGSVTKTLWVKNVGTANTSASFQVVRGNGDGCDAFRVGATDNCTGRTVLIGEACDIQFVFAPNNTGTKTCTADAEDADYANNPGYSATIEGVGLK